MAHVDDLTFVNAAQLLGSDNLYIGRPSDGADPDKRTDIDELISRLLGADAAGITPFYEEGTWTPVLRAVSGDPTATYTHQSGTYIRIGRLVQISVIMETATKSGGSGTLRVSGLPFTVAATGGSSTYSFAVETNFINVIGGQAEYAGVVGLFVANETQFQLQRLRNTQVIQGINIPEWPNTGRIRASGTYTWAGP